MNNLADSWEWFVNEAHQLAIRKGWWESDRSFLECMGLVVSELGEAIEAFRAPSCSKKILAHSHAAEELADIIIRLADMCGRWDIHPWDRLSIQIGPEKFDTCCKGTYEDKFSDCFDILRELPWISPLYSPTNAVEHLAGATCHLSDAIIAFKEEDGIDLEDSIGSAILAIAHLAEMERIDLGEAIIDKHRYNQSRSYRHGAKTY